MINRIQIKLDYFLMADRKLDHLAVSDVYARISITMGRIRMGLIAFAIKSFIK